MTAMVAPHSHTRQHTYSTSRNMLNLDCSADLISYRRDLGPGVQAKCFEKTSDTIRAQLDNHRAVLLRKRQHGQASRLPSPIPRLEAAAQITQYHTASHPRPLQILSQPHAPQQARPVSRPVAGTTSTYPAELQRRLQQCAAYGHKYAPNTAYEVVVEKASNYMKGSREIVGTLRSLQEANMHVANVFLFDGYYEAGDDPTYEVLENGSLRIEVMTDGSTRGHATISVEEVSVRRTFAPKRP